MGIGEYLKQRRIEKGLSLQQVADRVGVSGATISKWENGKIKNMRRDRIEALAIILDISPLTILFSTDDDIFIPQPKKQTDIVGSADEERYELLQAIAALPTDKLKAIIQLSK